MTELTQARLMEVLSYCPESGIFIWKISRGVAAGSVAGTNDGHGYISIGLDNKTYRAHRLAWLYVHGRWPENEIDHIDRNGFNNRLSNLRECDRTLNNLNRKKFRNNTSGLPGVYLDKRSGKWRGHVKHNGKMITVGTFHEKEEAYKSVLAKRLSLGIQQ